MASLIEVDAGAIQVHSEWRVAPMGERQLGSFLRLKVGTEKGG